MTSSFYLGLDLGKKGRTKKNRNSTRKISGVLSVKV